MAEEGKTIHSEVKNGFSDVENRSQYRGKRLNFSQSVCSSDHSNCMFVLILSGGKSNLFHGSLASWNHSNKTKQRKKEKMDRTGHAMKPLWSRSWKAAECERQDSIATVATTAAAVAATTVS